MSGEDFIPFSTARTHGYNAEDHHQIAVATSSAKKRDQVDADDLAFILATEEGRRFLTRILRLTGLNALSDADPVSVQRSEGARSVGIEVCRILNAHSIHAYPRLLTEAALQAEQEQRERQLALDERERAEAPGFFHDLGRKLGIVK